MPVPPSPEPSWTGPITAAGRGLRPQHPPATELAELAGLVGARLEAIGPAALAPSRSVTGVELRAQAVEPGDLFAALPGAQAHGAEYIETALERGAVAVFTDEEGLAMITTRRPDLTIPVLVHPLPRQILGAVSATIYGRPSEQMQVIGITGTSGKTTTAYLVEAGLAAAGRTVGLVGTIETRINGRRGPSALTTPEAPQLHALFAVMREQGIDTVVMEVSSHALSLGRVDGTRFDIGAFTNLSQDHLDFHRDLEDYFDAKSRLFAADSTVRADRAVVCVDDEWGARMAGLARAAHPDGSSTVVTVASGGDADWTTASTTADESGSQTFLVTDPGGTKHPATVRLPGRYNVANAALAVAVCAVAGVDIDAAIAGIATVDVPGRVERVDRGQEFLAVVDYAHKPAALEAVIGTLRGQSAGRLAVVVGAGGDRDAGKRALMGAAGARGADLLVVTDDNPRTEDPAAIRAALIAGADSVAPGERAEVREFADRAEAIAHAVHWARAGDVVLVAGKGHETGQEIHGVKHPFDDREVLGAAIDRIVGAQDGTAGDRRHGGTA